MLFGGLWHGAGVGFLIWGAYHAVLLIVHHLTRFDERLRGAFGRVAGGGLAIFVTFHLVCIGWIFFRGNSETFGPIFASMAATPLEIWANPLLSAAMTTVLVFGLPVLITEIAGYVFGCEFVDLFRRCPFAARAALFVTAVQAALFLPSRTPAQFIYFQF